MIFVLSVLMLIVISKEVLFSMILNRKKGALFYIMAAEAIGIFFCLVLDSVLERMKN